MGCIRSGNGPVLVFIHGFLSGLSYWEKQIESLSTHFEVIAMDLPGYGGETQQTGHDRVTDFASAVLDRLDRLEVNSFHLVGHSMGGMIAQQIVLQAPNRVNRLVLYGTGPMGNLPGRFEPLELSMTKVEKDGTTVAKHDTVESWFVKGSDDANFKPGMELAESVSQQTFINALGAMAGWSAAGKLDQIKARTLVIWGDKDRSYIWQQPYMLWREINDASLAVMPGCSHNAHLENAHLFNHILFDFLTQE